MLILFCSPPSHLNFTHQLKSVCLCKKPRRYDVVVTTYLFKYKENTEVSDNYCIYATKLRDTYQHYRYHAYLLRDITKYHL